MRLQSLILAGLCMVIPHKAENTEEMARERLECSTKGLNLLQRRSTLNHQSSGFLQEGSERDDGKAQAEVALRTGTVQHRKVDNPRTELADAWTTVEVYTGPNVTLGKPGQLHGQSGQDWMVASLLDCKHNGWFVDLAANDAVQWSNTLMMERDFAWNGVCIEANMEYMHGLAKRQCHKVAGAVGGPRDAEVQFNMNGVFGGIVSDTTDNKQAGSYVVDLRLVPLADVLAEVRAPALIDYLSLDVEGAESIVMKDFPWDEYQFKVITVERPKADLRKQLSDHDYQLLRVNSHFDDETWISNALPNLQELLQTWTNGTTPTSSCMTTMGYPMPPFQAYLKK